MFLVFLAIGMVVLTLGMAIRFWIRDNSGVIRNERNLSLTDENYPPKKFFNKEY